MRVLSPKQQTVLINADFIAVDKRPPGRNLFPVDHGSVATFAILQNELLTERFDSGMNSRHAGVVKDDLAFALIATDQRLAGRQLHQPFCAGLRNDLEYRHRVLPRTRGVSTVKGFRRFVADDCFSLAGLITPECTWPDKELRQRVQYTRSASGWHYSSPLLTCGETDSLVSVNERCRGRAVDCSGDSQGPASRSPAADSGAINPTSRHFWNADRPESCPCPAGEWYSQALSPCQNQRN